MQLLRAVALIAVVIAATAIGELDRAPSPIVVAMLLGLMASPSSTSTNRAPSP